MFMASLRSIPSYSLATHAVTVAVTLACVYLLEAQEFYLFDPEVGRFEADLSGSVSPPDARFVISQREEGIRRRILILPGPHKTGTTSLQMFLQKLHKKGILEEEGWSWPTANVSHPYRMRVPAIKKLLYSNDTSQYIEDWAQNALDHNLNLVIAAEVLDVVAALSVDRARDVIGKILDSVRPKSMENGEDITDASVEVEAVIMYRTPRADHLVSVWKQQVFISTRHVHDALPWRTSLVNASLVKNFDHNKMPLPSLAEWLCTSVWDGVYSYNLNKIISAQLDPFGVAKAYARHGNMPIKILDMSGVEDVLGAVACDVMHLNCTHGGKVFRNPDSPFVNHKTPQTSLGMNANELAKAENILRRMDCHVYCALKQAKEYNFTVIHAHDTIFADSGKWSRCCESSNKNNLPAKKAVKMLRTLGCIASKKQKIYRQCIGKDESEKHEENQNHVLCKILAARTSQTQQSETSGPIEND